MVGRLDLKAVCRKQGKISMICKIPEFRQPFLGLFVGTLHYYTRRSFLGR